MAFTSCYARSHGINRRVAACCHSSQENSRGPTACGCAIRYVLLIAVLLAALFAFPLVGLVDPFSLLVRGMAFWGDPLLHRGVEAFFGWAGTGQVADAVHPFVQKHLLPFRAMTFHLAGVSAAILAVIFALELVARRFWCRFLCPAGAMFGLLGRWSLLKRSPAVVCKSCGECAKDCRMGALVPVGQTSFLATVGQTFLSASSAASQEADKNVCPTMTKNTGFSAADCNLCMDCVDNCPKSIVGFRFAWKGHRARGTEEVVGKKPLLAKTFSRRPPPSPSVASRRAPRPVDLSRRASVGWDRNRRGYPRCRGGGSIGSPRGGRSAFTASAGSGRREGVPRPLHPLRRVYESLSDKRLAADWASGGRRGHVFAANGACVSSPSKATANMIARSAARSVLPGPFPA